MVWFTHAVTFTARFAHTHTTGLPRTFTDTHVYDFTFAFWVTFCTRWLRYTHILDFTHVYVYTGVTLDVYVYGLRFTFPHTRTHGWVWLVTHHLLVVTVYTFDLIYTHTLLRAVLGLRFALVGLFAVVRGSWLGSVAVLGLFAPLVCWLDPFTPTHVAFCYATHVAFVDLYGCCTVVPRLFTLLLPAVTAVPDPTRLVDLHTHVVVAAGVAVGCPRFRLVGFARGLHLHFARFGLRYGYLRLTVYIALFTLHYGRLVVTRFVGFAPRAYAVIYTRLVIYIYTPLRTRLRLQTPRCCFGTVTVVEPHGYTHTHARCWVGCG